ncbi:MAG TPA: hypothetical protein VJK25_03980 [Patescibacteria group bacterium]|nr:hypothetical protein [Patescibacteria group bacterium]
MMNKSVKQGVVIQKSYRNLVVIFSILAVILIGVILYFSLSQATVNITPFYRQQRVGFAVQIIDQNNLKPGEDLTEKIPGEILEAAVENSQTFPAAAYEQTQSKASGQVTIVNNYSRSQKLVATTRLLAPDGKLYRLTEFVEVPVGGQVTTVAMADQAGNEFEIGPAKLTIPGLWEPIQDKIYAQTDGFKIQTATQYKIDQPAIDQAVLELTKKISGQALAEMQSQAGSQKISDQALVFETLKYSTDAEVGSSNKEFNMTLGLGVKALVFDEAKLKEIASSNLPEIYKTSNSLVKTDQDSFDYEVILLDENSENLIAQVKGEYTINVSNLKIDPAELTGLTKTEAETYLTNLSDVQEASVSLPFWTKYLPPLKDKINIQIKK